MFVPIYYLLKYYSNYSYMTDTLWFYSKDESTTFNANIVYNNNLKSFDYKAKLLKDMLLMVIIEF